MTYDERINVHIHPAVAHADHTLRTSPLGILLKEHSDLVALAEECKSDVVSMIWNRLYHNELDRRCAEAGVRWICKYAHLNPNRRRITMR